MGHSPTKRQNLSARLPLAFSQQKLSFHGLLWLSAYPDAPWATPEPLFGSHPEAGAMQFCRASRAQSNGAAHGTMERVQDSALDMSVDIFPEREGEEPWLERFC